MNFFMQEKIKNLITEFTTNKFFASVYFNVFCIIVYFQNYNCLINYIIITHVALIMTTEIVNFIKKIKQDRYNKMHLEYVLAHSLSNDCNRK